MTTLPCPWCEHDLVLAAQEAATTLRCDDCATVVDLAPEPVAEERLPLAA